MTNDRECFFLLWHDTIYVYISFWRYFFSFLSHEIKFTKRKEKKNVGEERNRGLALLFSASETFARTSQLSERSDSFFSRKWKTVICFCRWLWVIKFLRRGWKRGKDLAECLPAIKYGMQTRDNDPPRLRTSLHVAFSQLWEIDLAWRSRGVVSSQGWNEDES